MHACRSTLEDPTAEQRVDLRGLAGHVIALAAWGVAPAAEIPDLLGRDENRRELALAATLAHLDRGTSELVARVAAARSRPGSAATLAELGAGRMLPAGTRVPMSLLGEDHQTAVGTATLSHWLPTMAQVRRALAPLPQLLGLPGVACTAVDPHDPWRRAALVPPPPDSPGLRPPDPRLTVIVTVGTSGSEVELLVLDSFAEQVPDPQAELGVAFDAATPSAVPPQAVLLVPAPHPDIDLTAADLPAAVLRARTMTRARMAETATLRAAGLGPLAAACLLPQDGDTGCPLEDPKALPGWDRPAALIPMPTHEDTADVVAATTADASWMLGVQWRLGEHLGEDAASPLEVSLDVVSAPIAEPLLASQPAETLVERSGWRRDLLHHTAQWGSGTETISVDRHDAGALDWWSVRRSHPVVPAGPPRIERCMPSRLRWPGQPRRRYWEVDDATLDPVGHGPDRGHPATLHLVDVVSRLGDDWYRVAVRGGAGDFVGVSGATLTDAAGGTWKLRTEPGWSLFAVGGADPAPADLPPGASFFRVLPVLLGGAAALEGEPEEEVALAVDEDANLLWAAVRRAEPSPPAAEGPVAPVGLTAQSRVLHSDSLTVDWALGGPPPVDRVPYLYGGLVPPGAVGHEGDVFVQAQLRDPVSGLLVDLPQPVLFEDEHVGDGPHILRPLAVPASGLRLLRRPVLARDVSGAPLLWARSERLPLDMAVDAAMPWDVLTPRTEEESPPVPAAE